MIKYFKGECVKFIMIFWEEQQQIISVKLCWCELLMEIEKESSNYFVIMKSHVGQII